MYKYADTDGKPKNVYSCKLEPSDTLPKGKRHCVALRDKEREIQRNIDDRIVSIGNQFIVAELERNISCKRQVLDHVEFL